MTGDTRFLSAPTRVLLFTGKGGVGKTSLACATAATLADRGNRVLLVSTDPASNLDEVLETNLTSAPLPVAGAAHLFALNIDPERAAAAYRERVVGPYRGILPEAALRSMEEQLSGACTVEIAAFDEFTKLLGDPAATAGYDHVIFDTAPTGHTLRLLKLPGAWTEFMATNTTGTSCLGPLAGLQEQRVLYESSLRTLADPDATTIVLVSRPDAAALAEAERTRGELLEAGLSNLVFALNGVFAATGNADAGAQALELRGREALSTMAGGLARLPRAEVPLLPFAPIGIGPLRRVFAPPEECPVEAAPETHAAQNLPGLMPLIDELEKSGRGVIMTMGKGGVGKTTVAAAIAVELAHRGHPVHISTTDPAAHIISTLGGDIANLRVSRIDPALETRRYTEEVLAKAGAGLDEQGKALLTEDLRSPCTEEIAVFRAFAQIVDEGQNGFVVLDTAPTGHTLLLLDAAEAYHREVARTVSDMPDAVRSLLPRLRDHAFTRVILVTLPEATPVHEAARLQADLLRAGIHPFAWVVNQSFSTNGFTNQSLIQRGQRELPYIAEVQERHATRVSLIPWMVRAPTGHSGLRELVGSNSANPAK